MITTFKFQNARPTCRRARNAQSAHDGFSAGRNETQHLNPGHARRNPFGKFERIWLASAKAPRRVNHFVDGFSNVWIAVAKHQWAKALAEINVVLSFDRGQDRALGAAKKYRCAAD